jgi:hypothetical protein
VDGGREMKKYLIAAGVLVVLSFFLPWKIILLLAAGGAAVWVVLALAALFIIGRK